MAHFAIIAPPLAGHINPMLALARVLVERGHRVTFLQQSHGAALVRAAAMDVTLIGGGRDQGTHPTTGRGPVDTARTIRSVAKRAQTICTEAPDILRAIGADAAIVDQLEPAGALVARSLGLPLVTVANALPINREPAIPPPYVGWRYDPTPFGLWRNRGGYRIADWLMRPVTKVLSCHAARWGIHPRQHFEDYGSDLAQISQAVASIDFPRRRLPDSFQYTGPLRLPDDGEFAIPAGSGQPLIFASLGTLQGARARLFAKIARACDALGAKLVLAHGGLLSPSETAALPGNPVVEPFVPQRAVLRHADLAITHAGFNTVLDALSFGVPMVTLPLAFEQPATAARLDRAGVTRVLSPNASWRQLACGISAALNEREYRNRASVIQAEINAAGGVQKAADIIHFAIS
ncbi:glycosyltransferase [Sphingomonas sp. SRS2]|uniref:glycosyltransferase n=1 Tax=Sphingomonas sp. SRS2 TaxID=133190 RepID=UPI0006184B87|nr:nucleotide disphospho-sugar-binding domain-containing protein [Sphingomonas sp. SRS2]KKC26037.1 hypothetical protein WP12_10480 [Sphingomonas sp. SRS2]